MRPKPIQKKGKRSTWYDPRDMEIYRDHFVHFSQGRFFVYYPHPNYPTSPGREMWDSGFASREDAHYEIDVSLD
jgi:hypothetical protein